MIAYRSDILVYPIQVVFQQAVGVNDLCTIVRERARACALQAGGESAREACGGRARSCRPARWTACCYSLEQRNTLLYMSLI